MNKPVALENLLLLKQILGNTFWLDCGTLLGSVREMDFIEHDSDTDVGMLEENWDDNFIPQLKAAGFEVTLLGDRNNGLEITMKRKGVKSDIFLYYKEGNKRWFACWKNHGKDKEKDIIKMYYPAKHIEYLWAVEFLGTVFPIPSDYESFLTLRYGDWKIVDKKFRWDTSPKNIK